MRRLVRIVLRGLRLEDEALRQQWYKLGFEDGRKIGFEEATTGNIYQGAALYTGILPECLHDFRPSQGTQAGSVCSKCGAWRQPLSGHIITELGGPA